MPQGKGRPQQAKSKKQIKIMCASCGETKKNTDFYVSYQAIHEKTGRLPYCKQCLKSMIADEDGNVQLELVKRALQIIDRPFLWDIWITSNNEEGDTFGIYMKNLAMTQYRYLTWKDSLFDPDAIVDINYATSLKQSDFQVTDELIDKWGSGYTKEEYYYFEKKRNKLINNYGEKTSFHIEGLVTYIRFRVKEELATAQGNVKEAKEWASLAASAATAAKINVSQLSKSDISGGIDLLPQLFEAVESKVGIISILPKLKEQPYDDADLIIWVIVNYLRRVEDKPRVEYKEIWNFYDQMLEEFFKQKGYSDEKIKEEKEKRNNIFRDLSKVYKEPLYEDGDL